MPRKKRNRRNKRKVYKHQYQQHAEIPSNTLTNPPVPERDETPKRDQDESFVTLPNIVTPTTPLSQKLCSITSVKSRNNSLPRKLSGGIQNKANGRNKDINFQKLFDEIEDASAVDSLLNNTTPKCSRNFRNRSPFKDKYINNLNLHISDINLSSTQLKTAKARSNSSMSKLRSPGLDKIPIMVDVATQTVYYDNSYEKRNSANDNSDIYLRSCINIFETPKISQLEKLEQVFKEDTNLWNRSIFQPNFGKNDEAEVRNYDRKSNSKYLQNLNEIIHLNSYISPKVIQKEIKNDVSDCDISLFSPQLKTVSTPIEKMQKTDNILENMAKNILASHLDRRLHNTEKNSFNHYNNFSPKTPNNRNLNTSRCEGKVFTQKINKLDSCISKRKIYNSVSPKKINDISGRLYRHAKDNSRPRMQSVRNDPVIVPKTFSPQSRSFVKSNNVLNVSNSGIYSRFMTNIKKLRSRYSTRWYNVVKDVCVGLGITVRRKLSSVCPLSEISHSSGENDLIEVQPKEKACYSCKNYEEQVLMLSTKILDLEKELHDKMTNVNDEIDKIKVSLTELDVVKQKLRDIEEKDEKKLSSSVGAPPPPPPIPPPPPPLPLSASSPSVSRTVKTTIAGKIEKRNCENSRPVISLNDILNVKLKKTSDKPRLTRTATQPFVSVDMLRQIKLRPTSRTQTPVSIKDVSTSSSLPSSSPASTLTKLLSNADPNMRRLKRLRRSSRYSFDDSRKLLLRRERNNVEDS